MEDMKNPVVCVLMSTYNGEKYLREQIDSILNQKDVDVQLIIRDDGSSDCTSEIIKKYAIKCNNVTFYQGENIGVGKSFMRLLHKSPRADYYAFSDQDDIWLDDKLSRAISLIELKEDKTKPIVYTSNQMLIDAEGNIIKQRYDEEPPHGLYDCLMKNLLSGCTMVMNNELRKVLVDDNRQPYERVIRTRIHDTWVDIVANIVGEIIYDKEGRIYYRQHDENVVGIMYDEKLKGIAYIKDKYKRFTSSKNKGIRSLCARNILERFGNQLDNETKKHLERLANARSFKGGVVLLKDPVLCQKFGESKCMIVLRAALGWI